MKDSLKKSKIWTILYIIGLIIIVIEVILFSKLMLTGIWNFGLLLLSTSFALLLLINFMILIKKEERFNAKKILYLIICLISVSILILTTEIVKYPSTNRYHDQLTLEWTGTNPLHISYFQHTGSFSGVFKYKEDITFTIDIRAFEEGNLTIKWYPDGAEPKSVRLLTKHHTKLVDNLFSNNQTIVALSNAARTIQINGLAKRSPRGYFGYSIYTKNITLLENSTLRNTLLVRGITLTCDTPCTISYGNQEIHELSSIGEGYMFSKFLTSDHPEGLEPLKNGYVSTNIFLLRGWAIFIRWILIAFFLCILCYFLGQFYEHKK